MSLIKQDKKLVGKILSMMDFLGIFIIDSRTKKVIQQEEKIEEFIQKDFKEDELKDKIKSYLKKRFQ